MFTVFEIENVLIELPTVATGTLSMATITISSISYFRMFLKKCGDNVKLYTFSSNLIPFEFDQKVVNKKFKLKLFVSRVSIKIFSNLIGGMEIDFEGKIYLEDTS